MLRLKVCGLNNADNLKDISKLRPEFVGLNFYPPSKRYVRDKLGVDLPDGVERVGVFVNENLLKIFRKTKEYGFKYVQLHGDESPEVCEFLRMHELKVIKVFRVDDDFDFETVVPFVGKADFFLFDAAGKNYGGNGIPFNWNILKEYPFRTPYFIAGGLSPENIDEVLKQELPCLYALDINSGYEIKPGIKDLNSVKELIKRLKANDNNR